MNSCPHCKMDLKGLPTKCPYCTGDIRYSEATPLLAKIGMYFGAALGVIVSGFLFWNGLRDPLWLFISFFGPFIFTLVAFLVPTGHKG